MKFSRLYMFSIFVNGTLHSYDEKNYWFPLTELTIDGECKYIIKFSVSSPIRNIISFSHCLNLWCMMVDDGKIFISDIIAIAI